MLALLLLPVALLATRDAQNRARRWRLRVLLALFTLPIVVGVWLTFGAGAGLLEWIPWDLDQVGVLEGDWECRPSRAQGKKEEKGVGGPPNPGAYAAWLGHSAASAAHALVIG